MAMLSQAQVVQAPVVVRSSDVKTAVIVGAGPAGVAAAACLARRGWRCEVFERRDEPVASQNARGYPMLLNVRSFRTLRLAGLEIPSVGPNAQPRSAFYMNTKPYAKYPVAQEFDKRQYLVDRVLLGKEMFTAAAEIRDWGSEGGSIRWHWSQSLRHVDFNSRVAVFEPASADEDPAPESQGSSTTAEYDLLIGADGRNSVVRRELVAGVPEVKAEVLLQPLVTYKTFHDLPITPSVETAMPGLSQHPVGHGMYMFKHPQIPMFAMWKQLDGTMSGLMTSTGSYKAEDLKSRMSKQFSEENPGLKEWLEPIVEATSDTSKQRPANPGNITRVSQFHGPSCVLLGDAAHCVTAGLGQGCNMALESVRVFINTLDAVGLEAAPEAFTKARLADAHAMQEMEYRMMVATSSTALTLRGVTRKPTAMERLSNTLLMLISGLPMTLANKLMPKAFPSPSLVFQLLSRGDLTYRQVRQSLYVSAIGVVSAAVALLSVLVGVVAGAARMVLA